MCPRNGVSRVGPDLHSRHRRLLRRDRRPREGAGEAVTSGFTLYAIWEGLPVSYKVVYWLEKPDITTPRVGNKDDYMYTWTDETKKGQAGTEVQRNAIEVITANNSTRTDSKNVLYRIYATQQELTDPIIISGDGTTIVNVYLNRKPFTVEFDLNGNSKSMTVGGVVYSGGNNAIKYTKTMKYEQMRANSLTARSVSRISFSIVSVEIRWLVQVRCCVL